jgi:hypothetical protein
MLPFPHNCAERSHNMSFTTSAWRKIPELWFHHAAVDRDACTRLRTSWYCATSSSAQGHGDLVLPQRTETKRNGVGGSPWKPQGKPKSMFEIGCFGRLSGQTDPWECQNRTWRGFSFCKNGLRETSRRPFRNIHLQLRAEASLSTSPTSAGVHYILCSTGLILFCILGLT